MTKLAKIDRGVVDVVIPVYNNYSDTNRLVVHLQAAFNTSLCRIIVVDDASTEPMGLAIPAVSASIVDVIILRNPVNLGFAASVNKAIAQSRRDVVLLNSDTLVFDGWLDRLITIARSDESIATVTPMSNAATILSYPTFPVEYKSDLETSWRKIDELCAGFDIQPIDIPTGVGFCMLIRRACLDMVGDFDAIAFKTGYGEECDFCRRAAKAGWRNVAAPNVFVWHRGEGSFAERATMLRIRAQETLKRRYPNFASHVAMFIKQDPLRSTRGALDYGRIVNDPRVCRLHLRVGVPTKSECDKQEMYFLRENTAFFCYRAMIADFAPLPNLPRFSVATKTESLRAFLNQAKVSEVVISNNFLGLNVLFYRFARQASLMGIRISVSS